MLSGKVNCCLVVSSFDKTHLEAHRAVCSTPKSCDVCGHSLPAVCLCTPSFLFSRFRPSLSGVASSVLVLDYLRSGIGVPPLCFVLSYGQGPSRLEFFFGFYHRVGSSICVGFLRSICWVPSVPWLCLGFLPCLRSCSGSPFVLPAFICSIFGVSWLPQVISVVYCTT